MRRAFFIIASTLLLLTAATAQSNTQELLRMLAKDPGIYHEALGKAGINNINLYIKMMSGNTNSYYIKITNGYAKLHRGRLLNPSISIWTSEDVIDRILASEDPMAALTYAVKNDLIIIKGTTIADTLKILTLKLTLFGGAGIGLTPQLPGTYIQNQQGGRCGVISYTTVPLGYTYTFISQCGTGLVCRSGYCIRIPPPTQPGKKRPGEICNHGGECTTGNCLKIPYSGTYGSNSPATFACSCKPFVYDTTSC